MLPRNLQAALIGTQAVGFATLVRSVAFDRWITVVASVLLILGATAALRGRTWGAVLSFATAVAFSVAWSIGIAPIWFVFVGGIGALPFLFASDALSRVDRQATSILASLAVGAGTLGAIAWKLFAWQIFAAVPALRPSLTPQHGLAVAVLLTLGMLVMTLRPRGLRGERRRVDVESPSPSRVAAVGAVELEAEAELEAELAAEAPASRRLRR